MVKRPPFNTVYKNYKHKIYSYVLYRVDFDKDVAEDIVSDVFIKAYQNYDTYNPDFTMNTWLYTITKRTIIDYYRTKRPTLPTELDEINDETDPLYALLDQTYVTSKELERALDLLSPTQKTFITAQFWERKTAKIIAHEHNISHEAVRKQISRGLAQLRITLLNTTITAFLITIFI